MRYKYRTFLFKKYALRSYRDISVGYLMPFVDCVLGEKRESFYFYAQDLPKTAISNKVCVTQPTFNSKSSMAASESLAFTG